MVVPEELLLHAPPTTQKSAQATDFVSHRAFFWIPMRKEVIYVRGRSEVLAEFVGLMQAAHFSVAIVSSIDECSKRIGEKTSFLFVDASSGGSEAGNRLHELAAHPKLYHYPVVFVASKAESRISMLYEHYDTVIPVEFPFRVRTLAEKLARSFSASEEPSAPEIDELSKETNKRSHLLKNLDPSRLIATYGGAQLAVSPPGGFDDELLIPQHHEGRALKAAIDEITNANEALSEHIRRVTFAASAIANSLALGPERDANIRTSSLMLNLGSVQAENRKAYHYDLLQNSGDYQDFIEDIGLSAKFCREVLDDELAGRTLETVRSILGKKRFSENAQIVQDAQCTLIMEATDRAVWQAGVWNPLGLYRSLRCIHQRRPFALDPMVSDAVSRLLGEAACSRSNKGGTHLADIEKKRSTAPRADDAIEEAERLFGYDSLVNVDLFNLRPGMQLVRPILARDGTVILTADIRLSREIIARLWQLAAIRPLRTPVAVAGQIVPA